MSWNIPTDSYFVRQRFEDVEYLYRWGRDISSRSKPFRLERKVDVSGVSGTGIVAEGVEFHDGKVIIKWLGDRPSLVLWQSIEDAIAIHGHDGKTEFVYE